LNLFRNISESFKKIGIRIDEIDSTYKKLHPQGNKQNEGEKSKVLSKENSE